MGYHYFSDKIVLNKKHSIVVSRLGSFVDNRPAIG